MLQRYVPYCIQFRHTTETFNTSYKDHPFSQSTASVPGTEGKGNNGDAREINYLYTYPARLPAQLAGRWGQRNEIVYAEKKVFCTEPTRAAKAEQKSFVPARQAQGTNQGRTPFICILWVIIQLSFNSQQGPGFRIRIDLMRIRIRIRIQHFF